MLNSFQFLEQCTTSLLQQNAAQTAVQEEIELKSRNLNRLFREALFKAQDLHEELCCKGNELKEGIYYNNLSSERTQQNLTKLELQLSLHMEQDEAAHNICSSIESLRASAEARVQHIMTIFSALELESQIQNQKMQYHRAEEKRRGIIEAVKYLQVLKFSQLILTYDVKRVTEALHRQKVRNDGLEKELGKIDKVILVLREGNERGSVKAQNKFSSFDVIYAEINLIQRESIPLQKFISNFPERRALKKEDIADLEISLKGKRDEQLCLQTALAHEEEHCKSLMATKSCFHEEMIFLENTINKVLTSGVLEKWSKQIGGLCNSSRTAQEASFENAKKLLHIVRYVFNKQDAVINCSAKLKSLEEEYSTQQKIELNCHKKHCDALRRKREVRREKEMQRILFGLRCEEEHCREWIAQSSLQYMNQVSFTLSREFQERVQISNEEHESLILYKGNFNIQRSALEANCEVKKSLEILQKRLGKSNAMSILTEHVPTIKVSDYTKKRIRSPALLESKCATSLESVQQNLSDCIECPGAPVVPPYNLKKDAPKVNFTIPPPTPPAASLSRTPEAGAGLQSALPEKNSICENKASASPSAFRAQAISTARSLFRSPSEIRKEKTTSPGMASNSSKNITFQIPSKAEVMPEKRETPVTQLDLEKRLNSLRRESIGNGFASGKSLKEASNLCPIVHRRDRVASVRTPATTHHVSKQILHKPLSTSVTSKITATSVSHPAPGRIKASSRKTSPDFKKATRRLDSGSNLDFFMDF